MRQRKDIKDTSSIVFRLTFTTLISKSIELISNGFKFKLGGTIDSRTDLINRNLEGLLVGLGARFL
jgi:hypothetical protein